MLTDMRFEFTKDKVRVDMMGETKEAPYSVVSETETTITLKSTEKDGDKEKVLSTILKK